MTSKPAQDGRFSLRRWSQRKLEVARAEAQTPAQVPPPPTDSTAVAQTPAGATHDALKPMAVTLPANVELPPIESLTIDSDFAPFFKPQVDESIKRAALKQLFRDPRFNIMDGLDTYIDDYTQPDPIPSAMLEDLMQRRVFFAPPAAEADAAESVTDELAGDHLASSAEAIAPPVAPVVSIAPAAPSGAAEPDTAHSALETGVEDKADKS